MITINGVKFAKNESEFIDSLFSEKTCYGTYKTYKNRIMLYDAQGNLFAAVVRNNHNFLGIVNAGIHNNKPFYQYGLSSQYEKLFKLEKYSDNEKTAQSIFDSLTN